MTGYPCCCGDTGGPDSPCSFCSATVPDDLDVTIGGIITGGKPNATECESVTTAGTWTLTRILPCIWRLSTTVDWPCPDFGVPSAVGFTVGAILEFKGGDYVLLVNFKINKQFFGDSDIITIYEKNFGTSKPDCDAWSFLDVPYSSGGDQDCCDFSGSTLSVSAV